MQNEGRESTVDAEALREQLRHVYWIGGASGTGKSTIARRIAAEHGLHLYATDDVMADHGQRSTADECPLLHQFMAMDMDEKWVNRSPQEMLETFHWFRGEGFRMIVEDILRLPAKPTVIVEGLSFDASRPCNRPVPPNEPDWVSRRSDSSRPSL